MLRVGGRCVRGEEGVTMSLLHVSEPHLARYKSTHNEL